MRPESFAEGVNLLLNDSSRSRQLAVAAKTAALVRFHPAVVARRHLEIYRQVLGQGQTA